MTVDRLKSVGIVAFGALSFGSLAGAITRSTAVAWVVGAIIGMVLIRVPYRSGMRYSLSMAAMVAAPLILWNPDGDDQAPLVIAILVTAIGLHVTVVALGGGVRNHLLAALRHVVAGIIGAGLYVVLYSLIENPLAEENLRAMVIAITAASVLWFAVDVVLYAVVQSGIDGGRFSNHFADAFGHWPVAVSLMATGALFGLATSTISWWWAVAITVIPYAMAHVAFHQAHETRVTYRETIRALSHIPEVSAYSPSGHGDRTAEFAVKIGREIGMRPDRIENLEMAAQMHDIGRLTLNQPAILRMGFTDEDIARWGSEMIGDVAFLEEVADLVRKQHEPYRRPGQDRDLDLPIGAKIIKAASAYDHATSELGFLPLEALEVLHRGAAYDYDPDVVSAIRTVLEREGVVSS